MIPSQTHESQKVLDRHWDETLFFPDIPENQLKDWLIHHPHDLGFFCFNRQYYLYKQLLVFDPLYDFEWNRAVVEVAFESLQHIPTSINLIHEISEFSGETSVIKVLEMLSDQPSLMLTTENYALHRTLSSALAHILLYSKKTRYYDATVFMEGLRRFHPSVLTLAAFFCHDFTHELEQVLSIPHFNEWMQLVYSLNHSVIHNPEYSLNRFLTPPFALSHPLDFPDGILTQPLLQRTTQMESAHWDRLFHAYERLEGTTDIWDQVFSLRATTTGEVPLKVLKKRFQNDPYSIKLYSSSTRARNPIERYNYLNQFSHISDPDIQAAMGVGKNNLAILEGFKHPEEMELSYLVQLMKNQQYMPSFIVQEKSVPFLSQVLFWLKKAMKHRLAIRWETVGALFRIPHFKRSLSSILWMDENHQWGILDSNRNLLWNGIELGNPSSYLVPIHPLLWHLKKKFDSIGKWIYEHKWVQPFNQIFRRVYTTKEYPIQETLATRYVDLPIQKAFGQTFLHHKGWISCQNHGEECRIVKPFRRSSDFTRLHIEGFEWDSNPGYLRLEPPQWLNAANESLEPDARRSLFQMEYSDTLKELDWLFISSRSKEEKEVLFQDRHPIMHDLFQYRLAIVEALYGGHIEVRPPWVIFADTKREYQVHLIHGEKRIYPESKSLPFYEHLQAKAYLPVAHHELDADLRGILLFIGRYTQVFLNPK